MKMEETLRPEANTVTEAVRELQVEVHNENKFRVQNLKPFITEWKPVLQKFIREGAISLFENDEQLFTLALFCENLRNRNFTMPQIATALTAYKSALKKEVIPNVDLAEVKC